MTRLGGAGGKTILVSGCGMSDGTERAGLTESTPGNSVGFLDGALSGGYATRSAQSEVNSLPSRAAKGGSIYSLRRALAGTDAQRR